VYWKIARRFVLAILAAELIGTFLYFAIGDRFVFYFARQYEPIGLVAIFFLLPALALALVTLPQKSGRSKEGQSAGAMAGSLLIAVGMLFYAPIGWASLATWVFGQEHSHLAAELDEVGAHQGFWRKGCDQNGSLGLPRATAKVCLGGLGKLPMVRGPVFVDGRESILGFFVQKIEKNGP
jgi:hypothetical protein